MGPVVLTLILALLVSAGVVALSALLALGGPEGVRDQLREVRAGLRSRGARAALREPAADPDAADDDEASVAEIFVVGRPDDGYVDADELADVLQRAGTAVVGGVAQVGRRVRR